MAVYNPLPKSNLRVEDIRDTLNAGGGSYSDDVVTFFTQGNINWESKHKPVRLEKNFCQDIDINKSDYDEFWWQAHDGNCGMLPPAYSSIPDLIKLYDGNMNGWTYMAPTGGERYPYRLGDFAGYSRISGQMNNGFAVESNADETKFHFNTIASNQYTLSWADFPRFKGYYFGVFCQKVSGDDYYLKTMDQPIKDVLSPSITIDRETFKAGQWKAYYILAEVNEEGKRFPAGNCVTIPYATVKTFTPEGGNTDTPTGSNVRISITAEYQTETSLYIKVDVETKVTSYISGNAIRIRLQRNNWDADMEVTEKQIDINPFKGTQTIFNDTVEISNLLSGNCKVMVALNNYEIQETNYPLAPY